MEVFRFGFLRGSGYGREQLWGGMGGAGHPASARCPAHDARSQILSLAGVRLAGKGCEQRERECRLPAAPFPVSDRAASTATPQFRSRGGPRKGNPACARARAGRALAPESPPRRTLGIRKEQGNPTAKTSGTFNPGAPGRAFCSPRAEPRAPRRFRTPLPGRFHGNHTNMLISVLQPSRPQLIDRGDQPC